MERELCLVLDITGKYRLVLKKGTDYEIDEYTKRFESTSQIRDKYKKEIDEFLYKYKELLQNSNNPNYEGRIVVVIPSKVGGKLTEYQRRVLLKKHIVAFEKFIKDRRLMIQFSNYERGKTDSLVSDQFQHIVRQQWNARSGAKGFINEWIKNEKKKQKNYYNIIRDMMIVYENEMNNKPYLSSIDTIYEKYKKEKEEQLRKRIEKREKMKLQQGVSHSIINEDYDIDSLYYDNMQNEFDDGVDYGKKLR